MFYPFSQFAFVLLCAHLGICQQVVAETTYNNAKTNSSHVVTKEPSVESVATVSYELGALEGPDSVSTDALRLNQLQMIGSHNSFKASIDPELFKMMIAVTPEAKALNYAHPPLRDQLNLGLRSLELDLFHDPEGGHYAKPLGITTIQAMGKSTRPYDPDGEMLQPGFKVMHVQDIDFRSNNATLTGALAELRDWSTEHPRHLPVIITFNLSDTPISLPGSKAPVPYDAEAMDQLDKAFLTSLGRGKLIMPDDVRGDAKSLEIAVREKGWPTLAESRGKFLLVIDNSTDKRELYLAGHHSLKGRVMFVNSFAGQPEAGVLIRNHPAIEMEAIQELVQQGYLVRTRADAELKEAIEGDFSRFEAAQRSGAHVISTDFYKADRRKYPNYLVRFSEGAYFRRNPITGKATNHSKE